MKTDRTEKLAKARVKNSRQETLAKSFGTDRQRIKSFTDEDRGEDRRFETSLRGFGYEAEKHETSRYLSKTVARVTLSSRGRVTLPREMRARLGIKPGQRVSVTVKDGAVHIVPIRQSRKPERGSLPRLKPFIREGKQMLETPPSRLGRPSNPSPSKMKKI
jgi:AbrB family looped-hinge helix DNA binding protein